MFSILKKMKETPEINLTIKIGDWVTQASSGYWQIVDIKPKYASFDYQSNEVNWKKGDFIGYWAIVKKGFTAKMKPSTACECIDYKWCNKVSENILSAIEKYWTENPNQKERYINSQELPNPYFLSYQMNIPENKVDEFETLLSSLPEKFTEEKFWNVAKDYKDFVSKPPSTHILTFSNSPWELDEKFNELLFNPVLKKSF